MNDTPFLFDPADGRNWMVGQTTSTQYAVTHPHAVWRYNPWTGIGRDAAEVAADPYGKKMTSRREKGRIDIAFKGTQEQLDRRVSEISADLGKLVNSTHDPVSHPKHYTSHPSGIECIQVTEHMGFNLGNAIKYLWRADLKAEAVEDMKKAVFYIQREIAKRGAK